MRDLGEPEGQRPNRMNRGNHMAVTAQNGRLGRGLASLIGDPANVTSALPPEGEQRVVPIAQVTPSPLNPRRTFPEAEL